MAMAVGQVGAKARATAVGEPEEGETAMAMAAGEDQVGEAA